MDRSPAIFHQYLYQMDFLQDHPLFQDWWRGNWIKWSVQASGFQQPVVLQMEFVIQINNKYEQANESQNSLVHRQYNLGNQSTRPEDPNLLQNG